MANNIALFKKYITLLDEVYKNASLTADLDGDPALVQAGANANEIIIPKIKMQGLGDYSRNDGYPKGDVTLEYETVKFNYDRGRSFNVDNMDNVETAGIAFGKLASEFIRTKTVPELDAFRFATYAAVSGIGNVEASIEDGAALISALRAATSAMDEAEVPDTERYLYITPTLHGLIEDMDTTKSRAVMERFEKVVRVPQTRFYTSIDLQSGKDDETEGGYKKTDVSGADINFMVIHKPAVIQYPKHTVNKIISPEENQEMDAWKFFFRAYGLADAYENKVKGIYLHHKTAG